MSSNAVLHHHALRTVYIDHHGWLSAWLRRQLGCQDQAADLAHDTFLRLLARDRDLSAIREPRAYLHTIAKGLLVNHWKRRDIEQAYLQALAAQPDALAPSPETRALIIETLTEIDRLLASLPQNVRTAFLLSQLDGLTYSVIAVRLGVSERMVKKYMARAMFECLALMDTDV
ncbi:sigma-70 family RNA polymerase sigma factor [Pseudomonas matsuisoli]|uniref:ECF sigma factor FemI n=1 Tax=Pseudomonas matsuisoli TaxID=1515666 RepID=A0A917UZW2_9PSED|nr:sigma-70 family RNA polymerase sigma factor [Pseudomonas matsuisoli]GGK04865.1 ECF sigma factor FemI [Pseudomonas matsuisoli]